MLFGIISKEKILYSFREISPEHTLIYTLYENRHRGSTVYNICVTMVGYKKRETKIVRSITTVEDRAYTIVDTLRRARVTPSALVSTLEDLL